MRSVSGTVPRDLVGAATVARPPVIIVSSAPLQFHSALRRKWPLRNKNVRRIEARNIYSLQTVHTAIVPPRFSSSPQSPAMLFAGFRPTIVGWQEAAVMIPATRRMTYTAAGVSGWTLDSALMSNLDISLKHLGPQAAAYSPLKLRSLMADHIQALYWQTRGAIKQTTNIFVSVFATFFCLILF